MFGVSYGSFDFYNQPKIGLICLYSLKNPSFPEYICRAPCGVLCLDISTHYPNLIVAGTSSHLKSFLEHAVPPIRHLLMINMMPLKRCVVKGNYFTALIRNEARNKFLMSGP